MKRKKNLALLTASTLLSVSSLSLIPQSLFAQTPLHPVSPYQQPTLNQTPLPPVSPYQQPTLNDSNNNSLDDLPNNPQQMRSWKCTQQDKLIEVEAKDVPVWKPLIEGEGWQCDEQVSDLPVGDIKFSCEPDEIIGILTVTWIKGKGGQQQLDSWVNNLTSKEGMICKSSAVTPFGSEQDAL